MSGRTDRATKSIGRLLATGAIAALSAGLSLGAADAGTRIGWLWADQPEQTSPYTPDTSFSFNSGGGALTVTRQSKGVYVVSFAGLASSDASNVLATEYGGTGGYCMSGPWSGNDGAMNATVNCFDRKGNAQDNYFTLLFQSRAGNFGSNANGTAFLWADNATKTSYTPNLAFQYNSTGGTNTVHRNAVGDYTVKIPGLDRLGGHVQVTAYGTTAARCKVSGWDQTSEGTSVGIYCFDAAGALSDNQFTLAYSRGVPMAYLPGVTKGVWGWANKPKVRHPYQLFNTYQYNGLTSGKLTGQVGSKGAYAVNIPGSPDFDSSNELVTAYGSDSSYCNVVNWLPLLVQCYQQGGAAVDTQFDVSFQTSVNP